MHRQRCDIPCNGKAMIRKELPRQSLELICIGNGQSCDGTAMKRNELALLGKALAARAVRGTAGEWRGAVK